MRRIDCHAIDCAGVADWTALLADAVAAQGDGCAVYASWELAGAVAKVWPKWMELGCRCHYDLIGDGPVVVVRSARMGRQGDILLVGITT